MNFKHLLSISLSVILLLNTWTLGLSGLVICIEKNGIFKLEVSNNGDCSGTSSHSEGFQSDVLDSGHCQECTDIQFVESELSIHRESLVKKDKEEKTFATQLAIHLDQQARFVVENKSPIYPEPFVDKHQNHRLENIILLI